MALNFSQRPIFSAHMPEENLVSQMRIANGYVVEGVSDLNVDGFAEEWYLNSDMEGRGGSQDSVAADILDLLPSDPFGMDISTTFTAITGLLEDLNYVEYGRSEIGIDTESYKLFAGFNFIWNNAMRFHGLSGSICFDKSEIVSGLGADYDEMLGEESYDGVSVSSSTVDDVLCFGNDHLDSDVLCFGNDHLDSDVLCFGNDHLDSDVLCFGNDHLDSDVLCFGNDHLDSVVNKNQGMCTDRVIGAPHPALSFAIGYLCTRDLGRVSTVCKYLHSAVHGDPLLWKHVHIDQPSNVKITDDILLELTNKAQGTLQCLRLVECPWVTDNGLRRVLESNPKLTKLSVPGCTRISIEGIVDSLKALKSIGMQGVKRLRIGGLYGLMQDYYEELKFLLGTDKCDQQSVRKPRFYIREKLYLSCEDACAIDVEMCPRCQNLRLVYDCPAEGCKSNECSSLPCRACILCIQRCKQCGRCFNNSEYEETFNLEYLCSVCLKHDSNCQDKIRL